MPTKIMPYPNPSPFEPKSVGEIAASAFARFDCGAAPGEVVAELVVSVDAVEHLWRTWARLRGIMLLSPEGVGALREALRSSEPIKTAGTRSQRCGAS